MSIRTRTTVGATVVASIGEPWDFESDAGQNRLNGSVIQESAPNETPQWCLCEVSPFLSQGRSISKVGVFRRHVGGQDIVDRLAAGERVVVNFAYDATGAELSEARLKSAISSKSDLSFLAGSVQLLPAE